MLENREKAFVLMDSQYEITSCHMNQCMKKQMKGLFARMLNVCGYI